MSEYYINRVSVKNYPLLDDVDIPLGQNSRKHLILTGKNGSGKTTFLKEVNEVFNKFYNFNLADDFSINEHHLQVMKLNNTKNLYGVVDIHFSNFIEALQDRNKGKFICAYFEAKREHSPISPTSIENINLPKINTTSTKDLHKEFIKYIVRLRNTLLNELYDGSKKRAEAIKGWFKNFEDTLKELYGEDDLELKYYDKELNFKISYGNREFLLNQLSDGYSSLLSIITELILRMEAQGVDVYDMQGVVLNR